MFIVASLHVAFKPRGFSEGKMKSKTSALCLIWTLQQQTKLDRIVLFCGKIFLPLNDCDFDSDSQFSFFPRTQSLICFWDLVFRVLFVFTEPGREFARGFAQCRNELSQERCPADFFKLPFSLSGVKSMVRSRSWEKMLGYGELIITCIARCSLLYLLFHLIHKFFIYSNSI